MSSQSLKKEQIIRLIQKTWDTPYILVKNHIARKKFSLPEYHHSDGIGTKGIYHWQKKTFKNAVLDALAMNLNDLLIMGARPYAVVDHLLIPRDDKEIILEIIKHLSQECRKRNIAISGGEMSYHNNLEGIDLSITMLGFVEKPRENKFRTGDILIGLGSNGLHSNGFTKIREIFGKTYYPEFTTPTFIYFDTIFPLIRKFNIHGMVHVTGGAFTKLKDFLVKADIEIRRNHKLKPQKIFKELYKKNISDKEMYRIFNCGIGFILSAYPKEAIRILHQIRDFKADVIGEVIPGNRRVKIRSAFSNKKIIF
ncbi:hypothetical protein AMJ48_02475 [Parcubacteria bacterium DG_74_1]|nr:MAG: hypothetical protein AMJ48_02475 [Parcubacteria bacterium DG_74_1]